eukprot:TRINITY_DN66091_c7_g9_i1.p1 TRINITY_DN66091_c7_g9~~TRINITY_DN66091_c7_g9_i1.p1  ORF type:complete len:131 (+),score=28.16 TRINITY_DN66091_c7_g9_i1:148-540(+)
MSGTTAPPSTPNFVEPNTGYTSYWPQFNYGYSDMASKEPVHPEYLNSELPPASEPWPEPAAYPPQKKKQQQQPQQGYANGGKKHSNWDCGDCDCCLFGGGTVGGSALCCGSDCDCLDSLDCGGCDCDCDC